MEDSIWDESKSRMGNESICGLSQKDDTILKVRTEGQRFFWGNFSFKRG